MGLSRKRKKELRQLQSNASRLWESQQVLVGDATELAREATRQLGNYSREKVVPTIQSTYEERVAPVVDRGLKASRDVVNDRVIPATGALVGSAMSVWDAANEARARIANDRRIAFPSAKAIAKNADARSKSARDALATRFAAVVPEPPKKKGMGAGGVIAILLGIAAAVGVAYAAWQTLRADDELWVADDPLSPPVA